MDPLYYALRNPHRPIGPLEGLPYAARRLADPNNARLVLKFATNRGIRHAPQRGNLLRCVMFLSGQTLEA
jgi:hypothetical protein